MDRNWVGQVQLVHTLANCWLKGKPLASSQWDRLLEATTVDQEDRQMNKVLQYNSSTLSDCLRPLCNCSMEYLLENNWPREDLDKVGPLLRTRHPSGPSTKGIGRDHPGTLPQSPGGILDPSPPRLYYHKARPVHRQSSGTKIDSDHRFCANCRSHYNTTLCPNHPHPGLPKDPLPCGARWSCSNPTAQ